MSKKPQQPLKETSLIWTNKKNAKINGKRMAWVDSGKGNPIVFLHGNPTSSFVWRNVIPHLENSGQCIAPDLIGMGDSEKLEFSDSASYRFVEHRKYLDAFMEYLGLEKNITLVLHDWGSALGFDWANRNQAKVSSIAYMEAIVCPLSWNDWPKKSRPIFENLRSPDGEALVLEKNIFVERILPGSIKRKLTNEEMTEYRRPFLNEGEDRRPTLTWPREIPLDDSPNDVVKIVKSYSKWLTTSLIPKLFINADPGAILVGKQRDFCRTWANQTEISVEGIHFIQEDSPNQIGIAIARWMREKV